MSDPRFTVPPQPKGIDSIWRKTVTGLNSRQRGGAIIEGEWLSPGDEVSAPSGTLVICVDQKMLRWEWIRDVKDAEVSVSLVTDQGLSEQWRRRFKTSAGAFGATTVKKIGALLEQYPVPAGTITVVSEARRPPQREGKCRWCHGSVSSWNGHLVGHGEDIQVEHWQDCPTHQPAPGAPCALCGVTVTHGGSTVRMLVREGQGRWEVRHRAELDCVNVAQESHEECTERQAAEARAEASERAALARARTQAAERRERRKAERAAIQRAADEAEAARVAALTEVNRSTTNLNDKSLGDYRRCRLDEITVTLSDGSTTTRWSATTYSTASGWTGEDYDPEPAEVLGEWTRKADAQAEYRRQKFQSQQQFQPRPNGRACDNCGQSGAQHQRHDSSGISGFVCSRCDREPDYALSFA